jgi:hypothetical protein
MSPLSGKDADDFVAETFRRHEQTRADSLAKSKSEAVATGKEPFDLAKLESLVDTSIEGVLAPLEERRRHFEYIYYVANPSIKTLEEFAAYVDSASKG